MSDSWSLWAEFCDATGRETAWARSIGEHLRGMQVLPCGLVLDVGCGTGRFAMALADFTPRVEGIDVDDYRSTHSFAFTATSLEDYRGPEPDVLIFMQSFHLLDDPDRAAARFPRSTFVIVQMPRPPWSDDPRWDEQPFNAGKNARLLCRLGRKTSIVRLEQEHRLDPVLLERMFLGGYTSDVRALCPDDRRRLFEKVRKHHADGRHFVDALDVIIAVPATNG